MINKNTAMLKNEKNNASIDLYSREKCLAAFYELIGLEVDCMLEEDAKVLVIERDYGSFEVPRNVCESIAKIGNSNHKLINNNDREYLMRFSMIRVLGMLRERLNVLYIQFKLKKQANNYSSFNRFSK